MFAISTLSSAFNKLAPITVKSDSDGLMHDVDSEHYGKTSALVYVPYPYCISICERSGISNSMHLQSMLRLKLSAMITVGSTSLVIVKTKLCTISSSMLASELTLKELSLNVAYKGKESVPSSTS